MNNFKNLSLNNYEKRQQIKQLYRLGKDYHREGQYRKAEKFFEQAVEIANSLDDLSLMIKERFWLASVQRIQGKCNAALNIYTWLIEVAYNPELSSKLKETDLLYVGRSFTWFVELGQRYFPEMETAKLEAVIEQGLEWLTNIGKRECSAGLRHQRGELWRKQERYQEALGEMEAALAITRRNSKASALSLGSHLYLLGDCLREMEKLEESEKYYQEIINGDNFQKWNKFFAWRGLAYIALTKKDFVEAKRCTEKCLELAKIIESFDPITSTYQLLGNIYYQQDKIDRAINARIQFWRYSRQYGRKDLIYRAYRDLAELRIHQGKQGNPQRYIPKAQQWLQQALPLAIKLDRQVGLTTKQDEIEKMQGECSAILGESSEIHC